MPPIPFKLEKSTLLRLRVLQATNFCEDHLIQSALEELEAAVVVCGGEPVLAAALDQPNALPYIISIISKPIFEDLLNDTLLSWDKTEYAWSQENLSWRVLSALSGTAFFLQTPRTDGEERTLREHHQLVSAAQQLLSALPKMTFASPPQDPETTPITPIDESFDFGIAVKQTQRDRKNAKKRALQQRKAESAVRIDTAVFSTLGFDPPASQQAADEVYKKVISRCRDSLEYLMTYFWVSAPKDVLKNTYIPAVSSEFKDIADALNAVALTSDITVVEEVPSAFPAVQPMRAALYFDSAEGFGSWKILVGQRATGDLREAKRKSPDFYDIFVKKIKELSNGHFSDDNQKRLTGPNTPIPIYEAKMTRDTRLIYQVDVVPEIETKVERQVIRIFGIKTHTQMDSRLWDSVGHQLSRRGREYMKRCAYRLPHTAMHGETSYLPKEWPFEGEKIREREESANSEKAPPEFEPSKEDLEEMHSLLVFDKYVSLSQAFLNSILADQDVAHVFQVSPYEQEIIEHDHSCYVLGRSGTGKTTTMLFKMLGIENSWQQMQQTETDTAGIARPRQLFVTQSRVLADKVEEYFVKLLEFLHFASENGSSEALRELLGRRQVREEAGLVDRDEAIDWREDLPSRFSELQDNHFPMFITFDKLSSLLEADMKATITKSEATEITSPVSPGMPNPLDGAGGGTSEYMLQRRHGFVSYDVFRDDYWPHFPQPLTKGIDPALVFSEFMGVIKGSEKTLEEGSEKTWLSLSEYMKLSARSQATFAGRRKEIYRLFQAYIRARRERGDYDAADRTHAILREIREYGVSGKKLDFLYVDEVQDNLLIDAMLLRLICVNPEGLFWAGDTAQTISVGSSFRFNDLKAFLHRMEESTLITAQNSNLQQKTARPPKSFQLTTNFRSHGGIVRAAHAVVSLISSFWPNALDALAPEHGVVDGIKPVFFSGWDADNVRYESFLFGEAGAQIEFGAQQCILVRSDAARERLRTQVGDIGLILTLYESKGLEFNDVMLFNFFEDSTVDVSAWRVVLNALSVQEREGEPAPDFNDIKHAGVCSELKFLYVAVTRARKNLWIVDRSERGVPMRTYWMAHNLVQHHTPGSDTELPQLAVASTPEEWGQTARTLFDNKRYFQAMHAYDRAEMSREKAASYAYYLREQAHATPASKTSGSNNPRRLAYIAAAEAFASSAKVAERERREYYRIAATLYVAVDDYERAGDAYNDARLFTEAAQAYRKAGLFDKTVDVLLAHRPPSMDAIVWERLRGVSRFHYFKQHDLLRASQLFDSVEEKLEFTETYDLDDVRAELLEDAGRFAEAADLLMQEGRTMEAVDLYLRDETSPDSLDKAKSCLLDSLWSHLSFGITPDPVNTATFTSLKALFERLRRLQSVSDLDQRSRAEVEVFLAVERQDASELRSLGVSLSNRGSAYRDLALLCLDHGFRNSYRLLTGKGDQVVNTLATYLVYVRFFSSAFFHKEPWADRSLRRLFGLRVTDEGLVGLTKNSFLYTSYLRFNRADTVDEIVIPEATLRSLYRRALAHRMQLGVESVNRQCLEARSFEPCERNATGYCEPGNNCEWEHQLDQAWFNRRLHFYLLQGFMLDAYHGIVVAINGSRSVASGSQAQKDIQSWLGRVEEVFFPVHYSFGSITSIAAKHISNVELRNGLALVKKCVQAFLYESKPQDATTNRKGFTGAVVVAFNLGFALDQAVISSYLPEQHLVVPTKPFAPYLSRHGGKNILADLMEFYLCKQSWSLQSGSVFLTRIVLQQIPIDVRILCAFLDRLCNFTIFARRLSLARVSLHNLTLPRSWILTSLANLELLRDKNVRGLGHGIVDMASVVLKQLHTQIEAEYLFYNSRSIKDISQRQRGMLIARLCRCICLFGYNMGNFDLQYHIVRTITSLKGVGPLPSALYNQYVNAGDWGRMGRVAVSSMINSSLDEMILLFNDAEARGHAPSHHRVRRVNFKTLNEVYSLLGSDAKPPSALRAEAVPFIPTAASSSSISNAVDAAGASPPEDESHAEDDEMLQEDVAAIVDSMQATVTSGISPEEAVRRNAAALVFAKIYRRQLRLKAKHILRGVPSARAEKIAACFKEEKNIEWTSTSVYRLIFRGPLPHALTCVERLLYQTQLDKNKAKLKARVAQHEELEKHMAEQTRLNVYVKELLNLQKTLAPASTLHHAKDLSQLRPHVARVCALVDELALQELHHDRDLAYRGIVQEAAPPKAKEAQKPVLNTSDMDGQDVYDDGGEHDDSDASSVDDEQRMSE